MSVPQPLASGSRFGRYSIVRLIGSGATGAVYEAEHVGLRKRVAIKILFPELALREDVKERFLREGEASSRVHHPHVVDVTDVGICASMPYLVMEYLEGMDLAALIAQQGKLPIEQLADLLVPACAALAAAHEKGVIHRDLKPANIFLVNDPLYGLQPKILDFGISKFTRDDEMGLTTAGALLGTPSYMSPEQAKGDPTISARTDQYSLGVIMLEAVTGRRAFKATSMYEMLNKIVSGTFERPRAIAAEIPPPIEAIILRAMSLLPEQRFGSMIELGLALLPFAGERTRLVWDPVLRQGGRLSTSVPPTAPRYSNVPIVAPPKRSSKSIVILAVVVLAFASSTVAVLKLNRPPEVVVVSVAPKVSAAPVIVEPPVSRPISTATVAPTHVTAPVVAPTATVATSSTPAMAAHVTPPPSPPPRRPGCQTVTVTTEQIQLAGGKPLTLPLQRRGEVFVPLDEQLGRRCPEVDMTIDTDVPYSIAFPAIATVLQHTRVGVEARTPSPGEPIALAAGLGVASINMLAVEITEKEVRFRMLVGGELPKKGTPLARLGRPMSRRDPAALGKRLDALIGALPKETILYLGATATVPFGELRDAVVVAQARIRDLRLSWIE